MNRKTKYQVILTMFCFTALFAACDDWTDTESIPVSEADIEKDNPALYQTYLANLREYRNSERKYTYVWFDNIVGAPVSRGQRISTIPDSVDVVNLMNPDGLSTYVVDDMKFAQKEKGMQFVVSVSYPDLEKQYEQQLMQNAGKEVENNGTDGFFAFTAGYIDRQLALVEQYGYDGISVLFYGMKTTHLTNEEKEAYLAKESAFMSKIAEWVTVHPDKLFLFEGNPQNLTDKSVLPAAEFIVLRTELLKYASALEFEVLTAIDPQVPTDRFMVAVNAKSLDDEKTGYFFDKDGKLVPCIPVAAEWVDTHTSKFTKIGLGILNAQNDYYNPGNSYRNIREAIAIMNPSPKI